MISRTSMTISRTFNQIIVLSFLGVLMWVSWGIYQAIVTPAKIDVPAETLKTITTELDTKTLEKIVASTQLSSTIDQLIGETYVVAVEASESAVASPSGTTQ